LNPPVRPWFLGCSGLKHRYGDDSSENGEPT